MDDWPWLAMVAYVNRHCKRLIQPGAPPDPVQKDRISDVQDVGQRVQGRPNFRGRFSGQGRPNFWAVFLGKVEPASQPTKGPTMVLGKPSGPSGRSPIVRAKDLHPKGVGGRSPKLPKVGQTGLDPFGRIWPENGIPAQTGTIRTGLET